MKIIKLLKNFFGYLFGARIARYQDRKKNYKNYLSICAIFRNEAIYLGEWIEFHYRIGVDHFYLYNDRSNDEYLAVLAPWIDKGIVTLKDWHGKTQKSAYNDCIDRNKIDSKWIAFIDIDEFLFSPSGDNLKYVLAEYNDCVAIFVYWVLYGSSGHVKRPKGKVTMNYTKCMDYESALKDNFDHQWDAEDMSNYVTGWAQDGKSIVNPRFVREYNIHGPKFLWSGVLLNENRVIPVLKNQGNSSTYSYSILRINHYWSKSIEDLKEKVDRGSVCNNKRPKRNLSRWIEREKHLNVVEDKVIFNSLKLKN